MAADENSDDVPPDLGLLFATNAPDIRANRVFIDRDHECFTFDEAVRAHHEYAVDPAFDSQDVLAPRLNVQVFYGAGGVGKSSLSKALESRHSGENRGEAAKWPEMRRDFEDGIEARIDLASEAGLDLERALLIVRSAVAGLERPMHAFDLALSRYWESVHPDRSLEEFLRTDSTFRRAAETLRLPEQIQDGLAEIGGALGASSTLVSMASQLAIALIRGTRRRLAERHAIDGCRRLQALLRAEPDLESLSYYSHLLSWDLHQLSLRRNGNFHVAVFVDTYEDVTRGGNRQFERFLQRLVWLMPNVLFVVSGRNRLDWAEPTSSGEVDWSGPGSWPGLVIGASVEPTQHLVGQLSHDDCTHFLEQRLHYDERPLIPEVIRNQIAQESEGYPLYLDMAVSRFLQITSTGATPDVSDFVGGFPGLVSRVMRDLNADERRLARILSLLDSFDIELAIDIAELQSEALAIAFTRRSFVDLDEHAPFPYSIHRLIRHEIQRASDGVDAFTPADWQLYAQRIFDRLGERHHRATASGDRITANSALNQALRLADERQLPLGWCVDAAYLFVEDSLWEGSVRPLVGLAVGSPAAALAQTLLAIARKRAERRQGTEEIGRGDVVFSDLRETASALDEILESGLLTGEAHDLATYYAAEALRELGEGSKAEELVRSLTGRSSNIASLAAKGLVHRLRRLGRFRELHELIDAQPREALWLQMAGTFSWSQGLFEQAKEEYIASRELFLEVSYIGNSDELLGSLGFVCGLQGAHVQGNAEVVTEASGVMRASRNIWAALMARLGEVLLRADGGEAAASLLRAISDEGLAAGLSSIQSYAHLGLCLNAAISNDTESMRRARIDLANQVTREDFHWLLEIADFWFGPEPPEGKQTVRADWLDGVEQTRARWREVLVSRR